MDKPAEIGCWAEWAIDVEIDSDLLAEAVEHTLKRLLCECRDADVPPVGALTIITKPSFDNGVVGHSTLRRAVNLQIDPAATWDWNPPMPGRWRRLLRAIRGSH